MGLGWAHYHANSEDDELSQVEVHDVHGRTMKQVLLAGARREPGADDAAAGEHAVDQAVNQSEAAPRRGFEDGIFADPPLDVAQDEGRRSDFCSASSAAAAAAGDHFPGGLK